MSAFDVLSGAGARRALQTLAMAAVAVATALAACGIALRAGTLPHAPGWATLIAGAATGMLGVMGPLRIALTDPLLPVEIRRTMRVVGASLAVGGLALVGSPLLGPSTALFVCAACAAFAGLAGFLRMSASTPAAFTLGELARVAHSAGMAQGRDSVRAREMLRWTGGRSAGCAVGAPAPDGPCVTLEGAETTLGAVLAAGDPAAPVVLNLCSYTCPHLRKRIDELHDVVARWTPRGVRFLTVYIAEAHPEDGWRLEGQYALDPEYAGDPTAFCFHHARSIADRTQMARWLLEQKSLQTPVVLDDMRDGLLHAYNAWPIRLYVLRDGHVAFAGEQGPFGYSPAAVDAALTTMLGSG